MRSFAEYLFRAKQEVTNVYLLTAKPKLASIASPLLPLPDPASVGNALKGSSFATKTISIADNICAGRYPLLGVELNIGPDVQWRRDYQHGKESGTAYFRRLPYLDFTAVGDHKFVWELNRHQHLVVLGQAFRLNGDPRYVAEISRQLASWFEQNPFQRGINWTSALEVAFRVLSWIWVYQLVGRELDDKSRQSLVSGIYQHGLHLAANLSVYFSPNTHLLGEAVALFTIAVCFPGMPGADKWRVTSQSIVEQQFCTQVRQDGSHFEQSTYYHVYAVDFFLWFYILAGRPKQFEPILAKMADYLFWTLGLDRRISFLGDDDGGRFFYPYGRRDEFGRGTLATCGLLLGQADWFGREEDLAEGAAWWLGPAVLSSAVERPNTPKGCQVFQDSGSVFLGNDSTFIHFDAGPFGYGGAGHSHADTLSFCMNYKGQKVLIDPGTYTYVGNAQDRNWFRGTAAHNTVTIDGRDQAVASTPFRWLEKAESELLAWGATADGGWVEAECRYGGYRHKRQLMLEGDSVQIVDVLYGPSGEHTAEQLWHWGSTGSGFRTLSSSWSVEEVASRFSPAYGNVCAGKATVASGSGVFPLKVATLIGGGPIDINVGQCEEQFASVRLNSATSDKSE